ncbi:MAG: thiamine pyrophosphate-dependent dehydrogenase E1 component subunit alpha [Lentisphaeria bacterium]|nr:thiamine pyrophosphate-dependent dehydrogenase E1 component subunit alpha [Lentisphaeria bacterium]
MANQQTLRWQYIYEMLRIRRFEERLNTLFLEGKVAGTTHLCIGQEACSVGVSHALTAPDCVFSNHRGHGHLLARGASLEGVMGEIFGSPLGYAGGRGGSQHMAVADVNFMGTHGITAGTIPLAAGAALHKKLQNEPGVGVVYFGDGAVGEGAFHETLNMAQIFQLPALFVCENNLYAMSTAHEHISPVPNVADRAKAYNMKNKILNGNDVEEIACEVKKIHKDITSGGGPWLIELKTFRVSGHSRGDRCEYRTREEEVQWQKMDCIELIQQRLQDDGAWSNEKLADIEEKIRLEIQQTEEKVMESLK